MSDHVLKITHIKGLVTHADPQDLPVEAVTKLTNLCPVHGKLVRTFGYGKNFSRDRLAVLRQDGKSIFWDDSKVWDDGDFWLDNTEIDESLGDSFDHVIVYENRNLGYCPYASGEGYVIIAYLVDKDTGIVTLKYWDGDSWEAIDSTGLMNNTMGTFYHLKGANPIIMYNEILRLLPGATGKIGTHNADGIWIGYIDRDFFDEQYTAGTAEEVTAGTKDYQKGLNNYSTQIKAPDISGSGLNVTLIDEETAGGSINPDGNELAYFYRLSYIYDGVNEGPLSVTLSIEFNRNTFMRMILSLAKADHNKRITAIKVYRSSNFDSGFNHIHTIDLTRKTTTIKTISGLASGLSRFYIPALSYYNFDGAESYRIGVRVPGDTGLFTFNAIQAPSGTGNVIFTTSSTLSGDYWDYEWVLEYYDASWVAIDSGTHGVFAGTQTFISTEEDLGNENLSGGILYWPLIAHEIKNSVNRAIQVFKAHSFTFTSEDIEIYTVNNGLYTFWEYSGGLNVQIHFWDTGLTEGVSHPYQDQVSSKVNGEFALYTQGRLFQFNVVLDPDDKQEIHTDWLAYSELGQLDVTPVGNVIVPPDRTGGPGTGLALAFGSVILMKKQALFRLQINDPADPATWSIKEANFNRGNVAKKGYVQVGETLYICSHDGIYSVDLNALTAADETPMLHNRISEDINDIYLALNDLSEKPYITAGYDPLHSEIVFQFKPGQVYAYNILEKSWRQSDTGAEITLAVNDQDGNLLIVDNTRQLLLSPVVKEESGFCVRSKNVQLSYERAKVVRYVKVRYCSEQKLIVNLYADGNTETPVKSGTLSNLSEPGWKGVSLRYYCHSFYIEICSESEGVSETEIFEIVVEHD